MALGQDLLVHYDPQWAGSWLGGALAGISPTSPYTHHGTERAGSCGQEEFEGRGGGGTGERTGREGGHFRDLNSIFYCTVFFLEIGLEAELSACLGPDSGLLRNTNKKQQDRKGRKLC